MAAEELAAVLNELASEAAFEFASEVGSLDEVVLDDVKFAGAVFVEASIDDVASDVPSFELLDRLPVESSVALDTSSDALVVVESESCAVNAGWPARCSASSKSPYELSGSDVPDPDGDCPTGG